MSRPRTRRHRRSPLSRLKRRLDAAREHPFGFASLGAITLILVWLVLTKSLPFALAPTDPELALRLNPNNPEALIAKARGLRARLLEQSKAPTNPTEVGGGGKATQSANTMAQLPEAGGPSGETAVGRDIVRGEIRRVATQVIANDPLNAEAYRLLAETEDNPERVRILMQEAVRRSRRETVALFWLLNDSFYTKNFRATLDYADILLRTHTELTDYVLSYVSSAGEDKQGFIFVAEALARGPVWRDRYFSAIPRTARTMETPLKVMVALKERGAPPSTKELIPYLDMLISKFRADVAYNAWLQFLSPAELDNLGLLTNGDFQNAPSGLPFDWKLSPGLNTAADFLPLDAGRTESAFRLSFGSGRVKLFELRQWTLIPPGRYHLEGKLRGRIASKRGLRWQIVCHKSGHLAGETEMLLGEAPQWRIFAFDFEVPQDKDCAGQYLHLFHDSRSASEEFVSGEIEFTGMRITKARMEASK